MNKNNRLLTLADRRCSGFKKGKRLRQKSSNFREKITNSRDKAKEF